MFKLEKFRDNSGIAAFIALMIMLMLTLIGIAALKISNDEISISGNELNEMSSFYAAEAGLERASAAIQDQYTNTNAPPSVMPSGNETLGGCVVAYNTVADTVANQTTLTQGTLAGLRATTQDFTITSTSISNLDGSQIQLSQVFQCALVPLFQFAVFYGNDLEIAPGADMTLLGRVHSNGNLWLQTGAQLYMDSYVTCSGNLLHGRKGPGSVDNGNVWIKDTDGNYQNMKNSNGTFLSSDSSDWYNVAATRWGGRVQDSSFGQGQLNLPITNTGDPHKILERASGNSDSYENKADLKIINGRVYAEIAGTWSNITPSLPAGTITTGSFADGREGLTVNSTDIDLSLLKTSPYYPTNGVIYASDNTGGSLNALRLKNGTDIGTGLSIVSENPMYVEGDFNTINKKPAALMADAITFLSNSWDDSKSTWSVNSRVASTTTCNASIMTGNTNTTSSNYNGGLENLPRFLEKWSGVNFNFCGSFVNLWNSQQAIADWSYGSYYTAPNRNWSYDTDLDDPANHPPETPTVRVFLRTGWKQEHVGYSIVTTE